MIIYSAGSHSFFHYIKSKNANHANFMYYGKTQLRGSLPKVNVFPFSNQSNLLEVI